MAGKYGDPGSRHAFQPFFARIITNNITLNQSIQNLATIFKQNT